jgi:hypothetical protein
MLVVALIAAGVSLSAPAVHRARIVREQSPHRGLRTVT